MKQFSLDEYLKNPSRKVVTRDGRSVKIHCTNYIGAQHIIAQVEGYDYSTSFFKDGRYANDKDDSHLDLFFAAEKHQRWINIYKGEGGYYTGAILHSTKGEAEDVGKQYTDYITTIKIEWEE